MTLYLSRCDYLASLYHCRASIRENPKHLFGSGIAPYLLYAYYRETDKR